MFAARPIVLHVTEVTGGGVEHAIRQYVGNLPEFEHVVLAPPDGGLAQDLSADFVAFSRKGPARGAEILRIANRVAPALVHAHSSWAGLHSRVVRLGVPVAYQPHAFAFSGYASSPVVRRGYRIAEKTLARRAASFITLSEHEATLARSLSSSVPIAHVVNISGIARESDETPSWTPPDVPKVAMAGRVAAQKDPDFYIRFALILRDLVPGVALSWIGDGDEVLCGRLRNAGVEVTGWLPQQEVVDRLTKTSLYVHTARYEGFPLSVLDAAAAGVPVVLRETPSTAGIKLLQAESAPSLAQLAARVLGGAALNEARELTRSIHTGHSASAQRSSLLHAYQTTLNATSGEGR